MFQRRGVIQLEIGNHDVEEMELAAESGLAARTNKFQAIGDAGRNSRRILRPACSAAAELVMHATRLESTAAAAMSFEPASTTGAFRSGQYGLVAA